MFDRVRWMRGTVSLAALVCLGLMLVACGSTEETTEETPAAVEKAAPAETRTDLAELATNTSLVPSPTEVQEAMLHAGVDIRFDSLVQRRDMDLTAGKEAVALRRAVAGLPGSSKAPH